MFTVLIAHAKARDQLVGPRPWFAQGRVIDDMLSVTRSSDALAIIYATHALGVVWKGRLQRVTRISKSTVYRHVDQLHSIGVLELLPENHAELKAAVRVEKSASKTTTLHLKGEAYTLAEPYVDLFTDVFKENQDIVPERIKKLVDAALRRVAIVKKQADQMRLDMERGDGCSTAYCKRPVAIQGQCAVCYQAKRGKA